MQMHFFAFFCISRSQWFFAYFAFFCIFLCIWFAFSFLLMSQSMDKFVSRGVANDAAADVEDTPELTDGEGDNEPDVEEPEEPEKKRGALQICSCLMEILRAGSIQCDGDLEGPSASIVVEKRLWNCSVCASVVGLLFFFAFICIFLHRIFCNLNLHPPPPPCQWADPMSDRRFVFEPPAALSPGPPHPCVL